MNKSRAEAILAKLGFQIDWFVTGKDSVSGSWVGTIDPIGSMSIGGECRGQFVEGENASDFYNNAIQEAETLAKYLEPCTDPECDMHHHP